MTTKYDSDIRFRNVSGDKILRGAPVMLVGAVGQHGLLTGALMDASDTANAEKYLGMATSDVIDGAEGHLRAFGDIRAANTSAWGDGDVLYCDPETPGALTATKPTAGLVFPVAVVSRAHPDQGVLQVKGAPAQSNVVTAEVNPVTGGSVFSDGTNTLTLPVGNTDLSGGTGGSTYPAVTIEHLPASTDLAATVTPGGIVSRFGFGKQIGIDVAQAGGSGVSGDIQIAWTNDAGATFTNYSTIGIITAGGTSTITILMADALGIGFRVRLANVAGTLTSATAGISVRLS